GVDSSSVVAMMRQYSRGRVRCYTIDFEDERTDENPSDLPFARLVARHLDVELREVRIRPDVVGFTERMVYVLDEPQSDPAPINVYLICQQARADGYKVLLCGAGGDDIFSGYRRHIALYLERYWGWMPHALRRSLAAAVRPLKVSGPLTRRLQKYFG